ncbi:RadC family protein [Solitalea canadensis]|uniref:DNA repair protein radc n=1 Tax=Solitalea canadensis (strain ATCC 29591 / DSM 3403 / JCM 21819 / LMG 8368 / NBRC 15130 / NCIMB 12057 / USAM 9D) TaxID=929556 RepID=H8KP10_SOLCM|nr:DNA repair protein RadC [Solitalea canadensis]AFD05532.1 DNA repair protein radc [Solitalea canadensis DSM 3403]
MENTYENKLPITAWAEDDRPREKMMLKGRQSLSDAELIAILIGSGTAKLSAVDLSKHILNSLQNNISKLAKLSTKELMKYKGIGEAKAVTILAALELGRRRKEEEQVNKIQRISCSKDAYTIINPYLADIQHEEFWVILLGRSNKVLAVSNVSKGGMTSTIADPKIIFKQAIEHSATNMILIHNHPSGNLTPSQQDITLTNKFIKAGELLEIQVLDHLIIGDQQYYSFADEGKL